MQLSRALLATRSGWPSILLGLIIGLAISAFFTCNFAMTGLVPTRLSTSSTTPINHLFIHLLFKSTDIPSATHQESPTISASVNHADMSAFEESTESSQDMSAFVESAESSLHSDAEIFVDFESVRQQALHLQKGVEARSEMSENVQEKADGIVRHVKRGFSARDTLISSDLASAATSRASRHVDEDVSKDISLLSKTVDKVHHRISSSSSKPISPQCDISIGKWVEDDTYPLYDLGSCPFVDQGLNCHQNGRPDTRYSKWRWAPRDCKVPRFNGTDMLEGLRGKRMVFVGDSLNRNQWESMLCMLRESLANKSRIVQVHGNGISKVPGHYAFKFLDYNCHVEFYTVPYLVERREVSNHIGYILQLDRMDKMEREWRKANVLVFNTGHWWTPDKIGDGDNCFQEGNEVYAKLDVMVAYRKALSTWAKWVDAYINPQSTSVFFQGYSPVHFRGQWNSGGRCENETQPIYKESYLTAYPDKMQALESVVQSMRVPVHVLNITRLSDYRKDAHPATFGHPPNQVVAHQDCSHWCLPGLPDIWNELLSFALIKPLVYTHIN